MILFQNKNNPNYCMRSEAEGVTDECRKIQYAFFECKRSMVRSSYVMHNHSQNAPTQAVF